jgi:hypothetical protein
MTVDAWLHASVTSASRVPPMAGPMAVHVSVTIMSVSMPMQALSTLVSIAVPTVTRSAPACTKACASPPMESDPTEPGNSLHPWAAPSIVLTALQPPLVAAMATMAPATTNPGTYLKLLRFFMKDLLGFDGPRCGGAPLSRVARSIDEGPPPIDSILRGFWRPVSDCQRFTVQQPGIPTGVPDAVPNETTPMH